MSGGIVDQTLDFFVKNVIIQSQSIIARTAMIKDERYSKIYELVKQRGNATVQYLTKHVYASEATIRRDLEEMENRGLIKRVWGGAILPTVEKDIPPFVRIKSNPEKKEKIAEIASHLLRSSTSIFFDSSTTCLALVPYLKQHKNITVITSSLKMSKLLDEQTSLSINLIGGYVYEGYILAGHLARECVRQYHTDMFFFSCSGISSSDGITSVEPRVIEICREMMKHSKMSILLCDTSKVGVTALQTLCDFNVPDYVIMDDFPSADPKLAEIFGERLITGSGNYSFLHQQH